jgi:hypothetical protein
LNVRRTSFAAGALAGAIIALSSTIAGQTRRVASPPGESATEVGGRHDERAGYVNGKWLYLKYGRPIKRGRDLFGPDDFADFLYDGAPVWRAGANYSTRLVNELPIVIAGTTVPPGEYTLFVEFKSRAEWTFILSRWPAQTQGYDEKDTTAIFGAYGYTPDKDVVRTPMKVETLPYSFDQLSWQFLDITSTGGRLAVLWDRQLASVPFRIPQ